jgi:hypothetical protein
MDDFSYVVFMGSQNNLLAGVNVLGVLYVVSVSYS